jgi:hypothetical protein
MSETFYDKEIAPDLLRLAKLCETNGMSFLAQVEFARDEVADTCTIVKGAGVKTRMVYMAIRARGNVDALAMSLMRYAEIHGHSSAALRLMGVPERPKAADV